MILNLKEIIRFKYEFKNICICVIETNIKEGVIGVEELFENFEFNGETECQIKEINGIKLPDDYIDFMYKHNGGEGSVGKNSYMFFEKLEELTEYNEDYEISELLPNCFCFGGDAGGQLFCYNFITKEYFSVDSGAMNINDNYCRELSLYQFIVAWDNKLS